MPEPESLDQTSPPAAVVQSSRADIINSVRNLLGFLVLLVLIAEATLGTLAFTAKEQLNQNYALTAMLVVLLAFAVLAVVVAVRWPSVIGLAPPPVQRMASGEASQVKVETTVIEERLEKSPTIVGEEAPPPSASLWFDELRPLLHPPIHYTAPTYFLDVNLTMIDWNLAFGLIFSRSLPRIGGRHVKHFIVELANYDEVIAHAQEFTKKVLKGKI